MEPVSDRPQILPVESWQLPNGLRILVQPDPKLPLVALHLCYLAGSRHEPPALCGLAHLCEHLAARGAGGIRREIEKAGGSINGATLHDRTSFTTLLPADRLRLGLLGEARRMRDPGAGLPADAFEAERQVLLQERRQMVESIPARRTVERLHRLLYPADHPYHHPPGGTAEGLRAITAPDPDLYFRINYTSDQAVLVLTGDVSPARARAEVEEAFAAGPGGPSPTDERSGSLPALAPLDGERRETCEDRVSRSRIHVAFRAPGYGSRGWYGASLLARSFAVGKSSPLQRHLIEETGLALSLEAHLISLREASTVIWAATAAPGVEPRHLEDALCDGVDRLLAQGVSEPLVRRARIKALTDFYSVAQRLDRRADLLASAAAYLDAPGWLADEEGRYRDLQAEELTSLARDLCRPERRVVLSVLPGGDGHAH